MLAAIAARARAPSGTIARKTLERANASPATSAADRASGQAKMLP